MPLTDQEQRCIDLATRFLSTRIGGSWIVQTYLGGLYPSEPTPEVVLTDEDRQSRLEGQRKVLNSTEGLDM